MNDALMMNAVNMATSDWGSRRQAQRNWEYQQKQAELQFNYNMQFQKDAQEFAASQTEAQNQFTLDMWNRTNEYNSPSAQVQRLREAGFNPYIQGMQGSTASQSNTPSASSAGQSSVSMPSGQQSTMPYTPVSAVMQHLANAKLTKYQSDLLEEEAKGKGIDNLTRNMQNLAAIREMMANTDNKHLLNTYQRIANMFVRDMYEQDYVNKVQQNRNLMLQNESMGFTIAAQALQNSYLPEQLQLDISMKNAQLYTEFQRGKLTKSQYEHELIKAMLTKEQVKGSQFDNEGKEIANYKSVLDYSTASEIAGYIVRKAAADAEMAENNKYPANPWQDSYRNPVGKYYRGLTVGFDWIPPFIRMK